ncbi:MAG: hypothetical protein HKP40_11215 [Litoreibacter sp.]|nr:hypothetical protein [Litoreibacter sp.]
MTDQNDKAAPGSEAELDALFAEARAQTTAPSEKLMARILEDAHRLQPSAQTLPGTVPPIWSRIHGALGGWPIIGGLTATVMVGIYIGFSDPTLVQLQGLVDEDVEISDFFASDTLFFEEGTS